MPFEPYQPPPQPARRETPASLLIGRAMALIPTPWQWSRSGRDPARHCILQALAAVGSIEPPAYVAMYAAVERRGFSGIGGITAFNDRPSTTHAQVLACMNEARLDAMEDAPAGHAGPRITETTKETAGAI